MPLLITGAAGFIGFHLAKYYLAKGDTVIGIDNLNEYYDPRLKFARLAQLEVYPNFIFYSIDIRDNEAINKVFAEHSPEVVVSLAAQAGVRYSLTHPHLYVQTNILGFTNIIEACRNFEVKHLVYASSSSVYGANLKQPSSEVDSTDHPLTIYAASKKTNELIAHSYAHLYGLACTGLRFFTVYGPWGRPDMAFFSFTKDILEGKPIRVYNQGKMQRDFTYIDDIVQGIVKAVEFRAKPNPNWSGLKPDAASSAAPYQIFNLGGGRPVNLMEYIAALEKTLGKKALIEYFPMQLADVQSTHADTQHLVDKLGFVPEIGVEQGIRLFVSWYIEYFNLAHSLDPV